MKTYHRTYNKLSKPLRWPVKLAGVAVITHFTTESSRELEGRQRLGDFFKRKIIPVLKIPLITGTSGKLN